MTSSLVSTLCQITKVRHLFSKSLLFTILNCLVFSKLFYCSTVWSGTFEQNIHKLQLGQNFAARVLNNTRKFDHISPVLRELGWSSIKHLLLVRDVTQLYKIVNGLAPSYLNSYINKRTGIHSYNTRFRENLDVPLCMLGQPLHNVPFTIDLSTLGTRKGQAQEIVKRSLALSVVQNWSYVTPTTRWLQQFLYVITRVLLSQ